MAKTSKKTDKKEIEKKLKTKPLEEHEGRGLPMVDLPAKLVQALADEVAKTVINRLPLVPHQGKKKNFKKAKKIENAVFLDTSAIIDGRVFDIINIGMLSGQFVILESILSELKHIADSQDTVKRERGRKGLALLEKMKKTRGIKSVIIHDGSDNGDSKEVDEKLISSARAYKGKIITCDYNLEKKASISGVIAININTLATLLKIKAVPGEALHIRVLHKGKDITQGVGYLDDGTMLVVEHAAPEIGREIDVIVSRVIQTTAGRILFAKKI